MYRTRWYAELVSSHTSAWRWVVTVQLAACAQLNARDGAYQLQWRRRLPSAAGSVAVSRAQSEQYNSDSCDARPTAGSAAEGYTTTQPLSTRFLWTRCASGVLQVANARPNRNVIRTQPRLAL
eukprot:scaffold104667_cov72-Phaeocystis_antarctica.AAC.8